LAFPFPWDTRAFFFVTQRAPFFSAPVSENTPCLSPPRPHRPPQNDLCHGPCLAICPPPECLLLFALSLLVQFLRPITTYSRDFAWVFPLSRTLQLLVFVFFHLTFSASDPPCPLCRLPLYWAAFFCQSVAPFFCPTSSPPCGATQGSSFVSGKQLNRCALFSSLNALTHDLGFPFFECNALSPHFPLTHGTGPPNTCVRSL